jgi:predicted membrane protein
MNDANKEKTYIGSWIWGVFLILIGVVTLLRAMGTNPPLPEWLFTWQALFVSFGFFWTLRHGYSSSGILLMLIGGFFLANDYFLNGRLYNYIWPIIFIVLGLSFILHPLKLKSRRYYKKWDGGSSFIDIKIDSDDDKTEQTEEKRKKKSRGEDYIDIVSVFGNSKKNILSKDFKGGDITNFFGGTKLNLSQADINGEVVLEVTAIFGGARLVVPSNWVIKSELTSIFGGIQDKRPLVTTIENPDKILLLKGTVFFGGIEISSY